MGFDRNPNSPARLRRAIQELAAEDSLTFNETPAGAINGANPTFTLQNPPQPGALLLSVNGLLQAAGADFTLNGVTITFLAGAVPQTGDVLRATYEA